MSAPARKIAFRQFGFALSNFKVETRVSILNSGRWRCVGVDIWEFRQLDTLVTPLTKSFQRDRAESVRLRNQRDPDARAALECLVPAIYHVLNV